MGKIDTAMDRALALLPDDDHAIVLVAKRDTRANASVVRQVDGKPSAIKTFHAGSVLGALAVVTSWLWEYSPEVSGVMGGEALDPEG